MEDLREDLFEQIKILKEIGLLLVEVHGQFDNQGLLNSTNHLSILDGFGGYDDLQETCRNAYTEYKETIKIDCN